MKRSRHNHFYRKTSSELKDGVTHITLACECGKQRVQKIKGRIAPTSPGPKAKIKQVSTKGAIRHRQYVKLRDSDPRRFICGRCQSTDIIECHHPRGRVGDNLFHFVFLCGSNPSSGKMGCHQFIHKHPAIGKSEGWLENRNQSE